MVDRANHRYDGLGGHLSTFASAAALYEVGFNHFFRGKSDGELRRPGLLPGSRGAGHLRPRVPRRSPDRGAPRRLPARGVRVARPARATRTRAACRTSGSSRPSRWASARSTRWPRPASTGTCCTTRSRTPAHARVWAFVGDGEMDEPESMAGLSIAARENLDNLIFVVNCNLQRLDGPVRGNHKVIQELEMTFRGRRVERDQGRLGSRVGRAARARRRRRARQQDELHRRRRVPEVRRRNRARTSGSTSSGRTRACRRWSST